MILLIDNYDSFTYNLYQYLGEFYPEIIVKRNDQITIEEIEAMNPTAIILSPGPGRPEEAGICIPVITHFYKRVPILGICLGHQAIACAFKGTVDRATQIMHGKTSVVLHNGKGLFETQESYLEVMRYHSLVVKDHSLPNEFEILARAADDGEIMAIQHKQYPLYGLQFHPESIGTVTGKSILLQFIKNVKDGAQYEKIS